MNLITLISISLLSINLLLRFEFDTDILNLCKKINFTNLRITNLYSIYNGKFKTCESKNNCFKSHLCHSY